MKKMNFSIQFFASVFLVLMFSLLSSVDINAQSQIGRIGKLNDPGITFKSQNDAIASLDFESKKLKKAFNESQQAQIKERLTLMFELYSDVLNRIQNGESVRNAAMTSFEGYGPKFGDYQSKVENRLVKAISN